MENLPGQTSIVLLSHILQFDGPRGLAILAVFIDHSEFNLDLPRTPEGGWNMVPRKYIKSKSEIAAQAARHEFSIPFPGETP
jgi:hypothetical protein